jgi:hypothetical protein
LKGDPDFALLYAIVQVLSEIGQCRGSPFIFIYYLYDLYEIFSGVSVAQILHIEKQGHGMT